ncbi:hypothetical protein AAFC00_000374 [Neodothiora populina]|uniref:Pre-mRNA-splicing factor SPF27 n=1 Tax=Neodothiora populina TaxID=2781224 RepID=A0ABR3PCV4_9PEZI
MPLIQSSQDYLPYIDAAPSQSDIASAKALVTQSLPADYNTTLHERLPQYPDSDFSDLVAAEHARLAAGLPKEGGIDLSRYEAQDAPVSTDIAEWRAVLQNAYTSSEYLQSRLTNLGLLETFGKNAWLISNDQLEHILRDAEKEVIARKDELEALNEERRTAQAATRAEMETMEQTWRNGIGRMIDVEVAAEGLRREILERKRRAAK